VIGDPLTAAPATGYRPLLPAGHEGDPLDLYAVERSLPADRPWVFANFVAGLNGAVAVDGRVGPLTSPADQEVFHHLRSLADVVLVGAGTVRAESYGPARPTTEQREARLARGQAPVPPIAVVSRSLRFDLDARFFAAAEVPPLVVCPAAAAAAAPPGLADRAELLVAGEETVDLRAALQQLRRRGVDLVLCEGGPALVAELLADQLLDELCLTLAPLTGGDPLRLVRGEDAPPLVGFELAHVLAHGDEVYLRYLTARERQDG
jgi:riboflavin biosynthesis pyrimidine reductase